jgi:hypothetical protein
MSSETQQFKGTALHIIKMLEQRDGVLVSEVSYEGIARVLYDLVQHSLIVIGHDDDEVESAPDLYCPCCGQRV